MSFWPLWNSSVWDSGLVDQSELSGTTGGSCQSVATEGTPVCSAAPRSAGNSELHACSPSRSGGQLSWEHTHTHTRIKWFSDWSVIINLITKTRACSCVRITDDRLTSLRRAGGSRGPADSSSTVWRNIFCETLVRWKSSADRWCWSETASYWLPERFRKWWRLGGWKKGQEGVEDLQFTQTRPGDRGDTVNVRPTEICWSHGQRFSGAPPGFGCSHVLLCNSMSVAVGSNI